MTCTSGDTPADIFKATISIKSSQLHAYMCVSWGYPVHHNSLQVNIPSISTNKINQWKPYLLAYGILVTAFVRQAEKKKFVAIVQVLHFLHLKHCHTAVHLYKFRNMIDKRVDVGGHLVIKSAHSVKKITHFWYYRFRICIFSMYCLIFLHWNMLT